MTEFFSKANTVLHKANILLNKVNDAENFLSKVNDVLSLRLVREKLEESKKKCRKASDIIILSINMTGKIRKYIKADSNIV